MTSDPRILHRPRIPPFVIHLAPNIEELEPSEQKQKSNTPALKAATQYEKKQAKNKAETDTKCEKHKDNAEAEGENGGDRSGG